MEERDLSVCEVAASLGVSERTVLREIEEGALAAYKARGHWRIERDELRAYKARNRARAAHGESVANGRH